jgi:nucleotide-binding universal stress UspA family protein
MRVLYATDGRPPAVAAGELLGRLAAPGTQVTILHASEYGNPAVAERYAEQVIEEATEAVSAAGATVETVRSDDDPFTCLERQLADDGYGLTVVGAGNHPWLDRLVFGSVSTYLLHHSSTPVLVVHKLPEPDRERIRVLIATDGSPGADQAIETLLQLADPERVELHVISVVEPIVAAFAAHPGAVSPGPLIDEDLEQRRKAGQGHLDAAVAAIRDRGFEVRGTLLEGPAASTILEQAEAIDADLVVVGARGLSGLARLTIGSVSAHIARHARAALVAKEPAG